MSILIWLVVAILTAVGEMLTLDLFLASVSLAAIFTGLLALFLPGILQVVVFASLSAGGIAFIRPAVKHLLGADNMLEFGSTARRSSVAGHCGTVTQAIDGVGGQIRIGQGEFWTARAFDPSDRIAVGESVEVLLVEGITALVEAIPPPEEPASPQIPVNTPNEKGNESW